MIPRSFSGVPQPLRVGREGSGLGSGLVALHKYGVHRGVPLKAVSFR